MNTRRKTMPNNSNLPKSGGTMRYPLLILFCLLSAALTGANLYNIPSPVTQPDGSVLQLLASGDEYANRLHDAQGYTIIQSPTDGYYYFAELRDGEPAPSIHRADSSDPRALGLKPGIRISKAAYDARVRFMNSHRRAGNRGPNTGTVNNLVVYIRFSDQTEFDEPRSAYDAKFNAVGDNVHSLRNYFHKASYNQLNYVSHHYPTCEPQLNLSYQDSHPRAYYMPYNSITNPLGYRDWQRTEREHTLLANAINAIAPQVPADLVIDADGDGYVDNVCFIIRGPHTAWAELLWAHRWALYTVDAFINNKLVWDFTFQPEDHNDVRTICHEMFHSVGAPDLYHYEYDGLTPAGCWDIMESGYGHMGMYMKYRYGGWIDDIPEIPYTGASFTLNPVTSPTNNCFYMTFPGGNESLVFEYRKQDSDIFEEELPGSGLLIYRINATMHGNADGPPDAVYIFRPNGSNTSNGQIAEAAFCAEEQRTEFNPFTNPRAVYSNGATIPVNIKEIGYAGDTISFRVEPAGYNMPPAIQSLTPASGSFVPNEAFAVVANVIPAVGSLDRVDFFVDGILQGQSFGPLYTMMIDGASLSLGTHEISVTAWQQNGMQSTKSNQIEIIDPENLNWFDWMTDTPDWEAYGRGAIPIQVAMEIDLGDQLYRVEALRFQITPDPWGTPETPGLVTGTINRFANGAITDQVLLDLGYIYNPQYEPDFTVAIEDTTSISGQIAVVLNLFEYQNMIFDTKAICGHTWITEPNRPWTDALGRGILGAADIRLLLQAPVLATDDPSAPPAGLNLAVSPNPFSSGTEISYELKDSAPFTLSIYNLKGQKVRSLLQAEGRAGSHSTRWDGRDDSGRQVSSGIYLCRISSAGQSFTRRMVLFK